MRPSVFYFILPGAIQGWGRTQDTAWDRVLTPAQPEGLDYHGCASQETGPGQAQETKGEETLHCLYMYSNTTNVARVVCEV